MKQARFAQHLARNLAIALSLVALSLFVGMWGYHVLENLSWIDAFLNASMLLGGMGPVDGPKTFGGKLFAGAYALYCGLFLIIVASLVLAPALHLFLRRIHAEDDPS